MKEKVGFIGLGLIGGSLAKAIRTYFPDYEIVAFDKNKEALALATQESVIDVAATTIDDNFRNCSYIFLCAPVAFNVAYLKQLTEYLNDACILTDVGSVKTNIHEEVIKLGIEKYFIGGHPMAGSEKSGYANSKAMILENAYFVLTPSKEVSQEKIDKYEQLVSTIHALPIILDYKEHDYITGTISHLPHIIAASLVNLIRETDDENETMKTIAAGGFKDITRIASSSPVMWQHICASNREQILTLIDRYTEELNTMRSLIAERKEKEIYDFFSHAKDYRDSITITSSGPLRKVFECYCDLIDEAGGIATIATILASNNISIKNIGIIHNREFENGVLRIELYEEEALNCAIALLRKYHYTVYER